MQTTKLSGKGQVVIPKSLRMAHHWEAGLELVAVNVGDGILLRPKIPFPESDIDTVAACLNYKGKAKTLDDMERAIEEGVKGRYA